MSNLAQYRVSLAFFTIGLLWVVSDVVGDGEKPGPLDTATKTIVHRLASANGGNGEQAGEPYELAVSEANSDGQEATGARLVDRSTQASPVVGAQAPDTPTIESETEADEQDHSVPDVGIIHK